MTKPRNDGNESRGMRATRMIAAAALAFCLGFGVTACGKRGDPEPPPGAKESDFPRPYPDPKSY